MNHSFKRILALAPHADDVELGAGGTITRWVEEGKEIFYIAFSTAEKSVPPDFPKNILEQEVQAAAKVLGIPTENLIIYKFEVRTFPNFRQNILETLVDLRKKLKPELVMLPSLNDVHQDHHIIAQEGIRAFRNTTILGYEQPWNLLSFSSQVFVTLQKKHLDKKVEAISCYQSQRHRNYANEEIIRGLARVRGVQVNCEYAEAFEVVRWIIS